MPENTLLFIIATVLVAGISAVIVYYVARYMRGNIKLSLPSTTFNPGEVIKGSFDLHTKKDIQGNKLLVRLIGTQVTRKYVNGKTRTSSREIYRDEVLLEEAKAYPAGATATYNFEIPTPNTQSSEFLNSTIGQTLTAAFRLLSNRSTHIKWKLEARLDAKGIDLATAKSISINIKQPA